MSRTIVAGEFYRHFKNKLYQIISLAKHSETGEMMVVYQALYGDFSIYVRPYDMFISEVDHNKYPDVKQKYRFEKVDPKSLQTVENLQAAALNQTAGAELLAADLKQTLEYESPAVDLNQTANDLLLMFLDADDYEQKIICIKKMRGKVTEREVDSMCMSLDMKQKSGDVDSRLDDIESYLNMQKRFMGSRLR